MRLAELFARGEAGTDFDGMLVSFAEVRMSADLRHATVLVAPLAAKATTPSLTASTSMPGFCAAASRRR